MRMLKVFGQLQDRLNFELENPYKNQLKPFNREEFVEKFFAWCTKAGIFHNGITMKELHPGTDAFGVFAKRNLPENHTIVRVPCEAMLSTNELRKQYLGTLMPLKTSESNNVSKRLE